MKTEKKYITALIDEEIFRLLDTDSSLKASLKNCNAVEIRYDLFSDAIAPDFISEKLFSLFPDKLQIGTIRLKEDGGNFPDVLAKERITLWERILNQKRTPQIIDVEFSHLEKIDFIKTLTAKQNTDILLSAHFFTKIPTTQELRILKEKALSLHAPGIKIAAMSSNSGDTETLYHWTKENAKDFKYFSAFAMGKTGMASRLLSLHYGANITYGALKKAAAPGQIPIDIMQKTVSILKENVTEKDVFDFLNGFSTDKA